MFQIPTDQVLSRVATENPWWREPHGVPALFKRWNPRPYLDLCYPLIAQRSIRRAVVLLGPRRVGKTVLIHHAIQRLLAEGVSPTQIAYFSVDHPLYNGLSLEQLLEHYGKVTEWDYSKAEAFVFFDEIQYLRDWEIHLKSLVDGYPLLRATASGSAAAALRLRSTESGAGRFTDFLLPPLTFHEYLVLLEGTDAMDGVVEEGDEAHFYQAKSIDDFNRSFIHYLNFGGYPEVVLSPEIQADPGRFIKADIIDKVLLRDLPSLYGIHDIQELNSLFTTLAFNTANEVSLEDLSKGSGVAKNTIKRYIEYLEAAFLLRVVHRVDRNARRFQRANTFKVYLTNPSLRSALFAPLAGDDPAIGALVETAIFSQWFHLEGGPLRYARWKKGEVDLVWLDANQRVRWAVEAKWSDRVVSHPEELRSVLSFCRANSVANALVTTRSRRERQEFDGVTIVFRPASEYCYTVGLNLVRGRQLRDDLPDR
jgi:uncharacterized protein